MTSGNSEYNVDDWLHDKDTLRKSDTEVQVISGLSFFSLSVPITFTYSIYTQMMEMSNSLDVWLRMAILVAIWLSAPAITVLLANHMISCLCNRAKKKLISKVLSRYLDKHDLETRFNKMFLETVPCWLKEYPQFQCMLDESSRFDDGSSDVPLDVMMRLLDFLQRLPENSPSEDMRASVLAEMDEYLDRYSLRRNDIDTNNEDSMARTALDNFRIGNANQQSISDVLTMRARLDDIIVDSQSDSHKHEKPVVMGMVKTI